MNIQALKALGIVLLVIAVALRVENMIKFLVYITVGAIAICIGYPHRELDVHGTITPIVAKYVGKSLSGPDSVPTNQLLNGTVILITGATNGIGLAITRHVCSNFGATVLALGRSEEKLKSLQAEFPKNIKTFQVDQSDLGSVSKCANEILKSIDTIHILVNNAGMHYGYGKELRNASKDYFESNKTPGLDKAFVTNYLSHFLLTEKLAPILQSQPKSNAPAKIIQISSSFHWAVDGTQLMPTAKTTTEGTKLLNPPSAALPGGDSPVSFFIGQRAYGATKLAQVYHARAISKLKKNKILNNKNIEVLSVCPTFVGTDIGRAEGDLMAKIMEIISFPVNGWGISSSLHAMFDTFKGQNNNDDEGDFIRNTAVMVDLGRTSNSIGRDILTWINGFVFILFIQKFYAQVGIVPTSPESKNVQIMNDLYDWSLQVVSQYL